MNESVMNESVIKESVMKKSVMKKRASGICPAGVPRCSLAVPIHHQHIGYGLLGGLVSAQRLTKLDQQMAPEKIHFCACDLKSGSEKGMPGTFSELRL